MMTIAAKSVTVVHVITGLAGGGAERLLLELCSQSLARRDLRMVVVSLNDADTLLPQFQSAGIDVHRLGMRGWRTFFRGLSGLKRIVDEQKNHRVVVHAHLFHACMLAVAARLTGRKFPLLFTLNNNREREWVRRMLMWATMSLRDADTVFPGRPPRWFQKKNAVEIPNALDIDAYSGTPSRPPLFTCLFAGRLEPQKNPLMLVEVAKALKGRYDFRFRIAGEGSLRKKLEQLIRENSLENRVEVLGFRNDLPSLMKTSHCLLLPSLYEGMPMVLIAAGAAGLPVVCSANASGGIVTNGNGYPAELSRFPEVLAHVMENYVEAESKAARLKTVVSEYAMDKCFERYADLYFRYSSEL